MFYYLYEIRDNLNDKIYVGVHKTNDMNDGYMGSGKIIKRAIKKHGIENFTKTVLEEFSTSEAMYARESEVVTDEFLLREDVYNLRRGGYGGFEYINKTGSHYKGYSSAAERNKEISPFGKLGNEWMHIKGNAAFKEQVLQNPIRKLEWMTKIQKTKEINGTISDCSHMNTPEVRLKVKETFAEIGHQQGEKNSQYGKMWITNGEESLKIMKTNIIPAGWRKGRVIKKAY